jgi:hypothetical protein
MIGYARFAEVTGYNAWQELVDRGINTFAMHSGLTEDDFGWGSPNFHKMVPACLLS